MEVSTWKTQKTTRIYLHMPLSERIIALTPDFKIINAALKPQLGHLNQPSIGLAVLFGDDAHQPDYKRSCFSKIQPGRAVYELHNQIGLLDISMEAFCSNDCNPLTYFRLNIKNNSGSVINIPVTLLTRSGPDTYLSFQHQEGYGIFTPNIKTWYMCERTWKQVSESEVADPIGTLRLKCTGNVSLSFISGGYDKPMFSPSDCFRAECILNPKETACIEGALLAGISIPELDYDEQKKKCIDAWDDHLSGLLFEPNTSDKSVRDAYVHLCMQMLQMLACYEGCNEITPRQGDFGRGVWPYEATILLEALDSVGLDKYTTSAYRYLLSTYMTIDGADKGKIGGQNSWGNYTGATLWGLSEHILHNKSRDEMVEFLPALMNMFHWIEGKRDKEGQYKGLFPPDQGSDWPDVARFWTFTDSYNAMAERSLLKLLKYFEMTEADDVENAYTDYESTINRVRDMLYKDHEKDEAYILPHELGIPFEKTEQYSYYTDGAPILLLTGFMDSHSRMRKQMEEFFRRRGQFENGLTGRITDRNSGYESFISGYGDVWYTQISEYYWIKAWMEAGECEKARTTMEALLKFGMTSEYVVSERYCSSEPYYSPWQPNASGSARMIKSMLCFYGKRRINAVQPHK